jgi:hypothetical protein
MFDLPTGPEVLDFDNPEWSRQMLLHLRDNIPLIAHDQMAAVSRAFINRQLGHAPPTCNPAQVQALDALRANGFCRLGTVLTLGQVSEIHDYLDPLPMKNPWETGGRRFRRPDAPASVNVAQYDASAVANAPHLRNLTLGPRVFPVIWNYLGVPPTLPYLLSWWSLHGRNVARDAQLFHVDSHDFKWVKLFVYLSDVDATMGPHMVVRGSHDRGKRINLLKELAAQGLEAATDLGIAIFKRQRLLDEHVEASYGPENIVSIEGRAGEAFLVDTSAIHKGLPPKTKDRLVFQALYTMMPTIKNEVSPLSLPGGYQDHVRTAGEAALSKDVWRYCNRMIFRDPEIDAN